VNCRARRVLVENGAAAGVEAVHDNGARVVVRAPQVVVACGSLESPALLLRSGVGGPAVGRNLRLHPCVAVFGSYVEDQSAWWGPTHAGLSDEFANIDGTGYGFLIEATQYSPGLGGSALPWTSGLEHKQLMSQFSNGASFVALTRDRGAGQVTIDANGEAVPTYAITDELDVAHLNRGIAEMARLHQAAGAVEIFSLAAGLPRWRRGDDLDAFIARAQRVPARAGGQRLFSAHQMGTCRMGSDPATSVANPWGELHDVRGVWIGDGSAFPTASGTNPMVSIMALAHRTAEAIAAAAPTRGGAAAVTA
jgi:choline dehydrogenase-like flavoprotein